MSTFNKLFLATLTVAGVHKAFKIGRKVGQTETINVLVHALGFARENGVFYPEPEVEDHVKASEMFLKSTLDSYNQSLKDKHEA